MITAKTCSKDHIAAQSATPETLESVRERLTTTVPDGGGDIPPVWVNVTDPTDEDWQALEETFGFHPLAVEDARNQGQRPKVDSYNGYLFLSVPAWRKVAEKGDDEAAAEAAIEEVDVFLGHNYLVTIHRGQNEALEEMRRRVERAPERVGKHPAHLLYVFLDSVVDAYFPVMDELDAAIDDLENHVYQVHTGSGPIQVAPALRLKKRLLALRQAVAPMRDVLNSLLREDDDRLFPGYMEVYYQDVYDHTLRLTEQIDLHRDLLSSVLDAMMAQTSNRLNEVMRTLTAYSLALMAATLIAGIYGMNFAHMPELNWHLGYPLALALMAAVFGGVLFYFKRRGWL